MLITELGISNEVRPVQPQKAKDSIDVTVLGITVLIHPAISAFPLVDIMALQLFRESYSGFPFST